MKDETDVKSRTEKTSTINKIDDLSSEASSEILPRSMDSRKDMSGASSRGKAEKIEQQMTGRCRQQAEILSAGERSSTFAMFATFGFHCSVVGTTNKIDVAAVRSKRLGHLSTEYRGNDSEVAWPKASIRFQRKAIVTRCNIR